MVEKSSNEAKVSPSATGSRRPVAQASLTPLVGVLMLDTRFPRFPGDIGHADSLPWPSRRRGVPRASVARVVVDAPLPEPLLGRFVAVGRALVDEGATLLTTSCGFLHAVQERLDDVFSVPVVTSSLSLLPMVCARHGSEGKIGIMTFDARRLGPRHLGAEARAPARFVIQGMERSRHFHALIANDLPEACPVALRHDVVVAARQLARHRPAAVVLECTNLSPWREDIRAVLGDVPVLDLHDAIRIRLARAESQPDVTSGVSER